MRCCVVLCYIFGGGLQFCIRNTPLCERDTSFFLIFRHDSVNSALHQVSVVRQCIFAVKGILQRMYFGAYLQFNQFCMEFWFKATLKRILLHFMASRWSFWFRLQHCILSPTVNLNIQTRQHLHMLCVRISYI